MRSILRSFICVVAIGGPFGLAAEVDVPYSQFYRSVRYPASTYQFRRLPDETIDIAQCRLEMSKNICTVLGGLSLQELEVFLATANVDLIKNPNGLSAPLQFVIQLFLASSELAVADRQAAVKPKGFIAGLTDILVSGIMGAEQNILEAEALAQMKEFFARLKVQTRTNTKNLGVSMHRLSAAKIKIILDMMDHLASFSSP